MADVISHVVRAEAVNFSATMLDTHDLSTIRGASRAMLKIELAVEAGLKDAAAQGISKVYSGASQTAFRFMAPAGTEQSVRAVVAAHLQKPGPHGEPFDHLSFVVDVVAGDGEAALDRAAALNRARQLRQWTVPLPAFEERARGFDEFDRTRPAIVPVPLPPGKLAGTDGKAESLLAASVERRRRYGRSMRQRFYQDEVKDAARTLSFVDSFEDIVSAPPDNLPLSLKPRIAVVYADGNAFGKLRVKSGGHGPFSEHLHALRKGLLSDTLAWFRESRDGPNGRAFAVPEGDRPLRLETLLWGGDELIFVLPSWLAFEFVGKFFEITKDWQLPVKGSARPEPMTHTMGVVICDHKTPIRQVRETAQAIADSIKTSVREQSLSPSNVVGIEIFENEAPPEESLESFRARNYGLHQAPEFDVASGLAFPGDQFAELRATMRDIAGTGPRSFPRSQINRLMAGARDLGGNLADPRVSARMREIVGDYERRVRKTEAVTAGGFRLPRLPGAKARPIAVEIALVSLFWDYANPFPDHT